MGTNKGGIILFGIITLVLVVFDVWVYVFALCDSFIISIMPHNKYNAATRNPGRCISTLK